MTANKEEPVVANFQLQAIYLNDGVAALHDFDPLRPDQKLFGRFSSSTQDYWINFEGAGDGVDAIARSCTFATKFDLMVNLAPTAAAPVDMEPVKAATVSATLAARYLFSSELATPTVDEIEAFGRTSALVHQWPYWREFCHSSLVRMHLPLMMVPLLVLPNAYDIKKPARRKKKK